MKLYCRVRALFTVLVRCRSIRQSVRPRTGCLSANQIKEFVAYFNEYTIMQSIGTKTNHSMEDIVCQVILSKEISRPNSLCFITNDILAVSTLLGEIILIKLLCDFIRDCTLFIECIRLEIFTKRSLKKSLTRPKNMTKNPCPICNSCKKVCALYVKEIHLLQ